MHKARFAQDIKAIHKPQMKVAGRADQDRSDPWMCMWKKNYTSFQSGFR